jgi:hypothetical protein
MKSNLSQRIAWLTRLVRHPSARCPVRRPRFRPALEGLEERALLSTLSVANLNDSGPGSLRDCLARAHSGDTIAFASDLQGTITLTSGELKVGQSVTIQGPGADNLSIDGNHASRVFEILPGAAVTMSGLTVAHGVANAPGSGVNLVGGGGIFVASHATLTLTDVISDNTANTGSALS